MIEWISIRGKAAEINCVLTSVDYLTSVLMIRKLFFLIYFCREVMCLLFLQCGWLPDFGCPSVFFPPIVLFLDFVSLKIAFLKNRYFLYNLVLWASFVDRYILNCFKTKTDSWGIVLRNTVAIGNQWIFIFDLILSSVMISHSAFTFNKRCIYEHFSFSFFWSL